jgi:hypothetical protein
VKKRKERSVTETEQRKRTNATYHPETVPPQDFVSFNVVSLARAKTDCFICTLP